MKKALRNTHNSIKELMVHITTDMYTKQTLASIFRCLLETSIEARYSSIVLIKLKNVKEFQGLLNRLKYSESKVYLYTDSFIEGFNNIVLNNPELENEEFLVVIDERLSYCLYWDESTTEIFGLSEGFCSLNPYDARQIAEHLQLLSFDKELEEDLSQIKQDRRRNENFTIILRKLVSSLESHQRDLICANTELKELYDKTVISEKIAAVEQLCASIVHEIRNPLGSVSLHARIISKTMEKITSQIVDSEARESINNASSAITNACTGMERLLTELIDFSKPMAINNKDSDLQEALMEVVNLLKPSFEEKGVGISFNYSLGSNVKLNFDKIKLNQAVLNVVKNALEASCKDSQVEVSVDYRTNDTKVYIKVKDQGAGILPENIKKIFAPYFTTKKEGTGLGLAKSKKILEAHGGDLAVISTGQKGTTFGLILPVKKP